MDSLQIRLAFFQFNEIIGSENKTDLKIHQTTYVDDRLVCYKLPFDEIEFKSSSIDDHDAITLERNSVLTENTGYGCR